MPEKRTLERAAQDKREGKAPSTQAGEFVREEIDHVREGKHGARSTKQAIAIGLSKARRAGVDLPPPAKGEASEETRASAKRAVKAGKKGASHVSAKRSRAVTRTAARQRTAAERSAAARKAAATKGPEKRSAAARKAASTRARHGG